MFFIVAIVFIFQIILLAVLVSVLLNIDINILILTDKVEDYNNWFVSRIDKIENIFSDIKLIIKKKTDNLRKTKKKLLINRIISTFEWFLLILLKPKIKKFFLGYKLSKVLLKELSRLKNMV